MKLHQRDLRRQPISYSQHLPPQWKLAIVGIHALCTLSVASAALFVTQSWQAKKQLAELQEEVREADKQRNILNQADQRLVKNAEMAQEIQSWLLSRADIEALYHKLADFVKTDTLLDNLSVEHIATERIIRVKCQVEGAADDYTAFFRSITDFLTESEDMVIADIQMAINQNSGSLSLDLLIEPHQSNSQIDPNAKTADATDK